MSDTVDQIIKALSHPLRREILQWLKNPEAHFPEQQHRFDDGVCAGQIFQRTGLSPSTVSAHLALLQKAGLVRCKKVGQWHFFSRNEAAITAFLQELGQEI